MHKAFLYLLIFVPISIISSYLGISPLIVFIFSALAIIPLAKYIGEATEEISNFTSSAVGGFLNATFGNATELIISFFALQAGLINVVKASLTGSIICNLLLVLGSAIFFGGLKRDKQTFNLTSTQASSSVLLIAITALVLPAFFVQTSSSATSVHIEELSLLVAFMMILTYLFNLYFSLHTHKHLYASEIDEENDSKWSLRTSVIILFLSTVFVSIVSEILVSNIRPLLLSLGWTELFLGVVVIAILGNAAEHTSAVTIALKNKMDLSIQIAIGSSIQIAMFVAPMLVFLSYFLGQPMNLIFNTFELVALLFSVFIVNSVLQDGETNWFEGAQLLITYFIIAISFFFFI